MAFTGMPDRFGESGTPAELMEKYFLTGEAIAGKARKLVSSEW
jgi:transketolase C-terminal domain/subunit